MTNKLFLFLIFCVLGLAAFLTFWRLDAIDLEASENVYLSDSVGYMRTDPYMVPRQHLRKPHEPSSPHPFLVPQIEALFFRVFGLSVMSARLLSSLSIVLTTMLVMFFAQVLWKSRLIDISAGLIFSMVPLVIRYGRMAVLDPMLMLFGITGMLWLWQSSQVFGWKRYVYAALCGIAIALCLSTKLTGIVFVLPVVAFYVHQTIVMRNKHFISAFPFVIFTGLITFILFNDPYSYYYGWTHFSDPKHTNIGWSRIVGNLFTFEYWYYFVICLVGPIFAYLVLIALWRNRKRLFSSRAVLFILWISSVASYLIINPPHLTGLSSEWAYLPLIPPLALVAGKTLIDVVWRWQNTIQVYALTFILYVVFAMPSLMLYGLRLKPLPLPNLRSGRNAVLGDLAMTKTISRINEESGEQLMLVVLKGIDLPLWLLRNGITTEPFYHPLSAYNLVVTDNQEFLNRCLESGFSLISWEKNLSEPTVFLLKNFNPSLN